MTGVSDVPLVDGLLHADDVSFLSFERAETYAALIPGVITLTIPAGIFVPRSTVHDYIDFRQFGQCAMAYAGCAKK